MTTASIHSEQRKIRALKLTNLIWFLLAFAYFISSFLEMSKFKFFSIINDDNVMKNYINYADKIHNKLINPDTI